MQQELVVITIPVRYEQPPALEKISLDQTLAVLHQYPVVFIANGDLDTTWYENYCQGKVRASVERFVWDGFVGFSKLQLSDEFYRRFLGYEYLLMCHLDAFVFRDELPKWCQAGYDYVGSVIYNSGWVLTNTLLRRVTGFPPPEYFGCGGFALKKVSSFYHVTSKYKKYIDFNLWVRKMRRQGVLDDIFLTQHFPKLWPKFRMPPRAVAERFGADYDAWDEEQLPFTNRDNDSLPFGVHGWVLHSPAFWKPCIRRYGYDL